MTKDITYDEHVKMEQMRAVDTISKTIARLSARIIELESEANEYFRTEVIYEKALKEIADSYCPPWHRRDSHEIAKEALSEAESVRSAAEADMKEKFEYYGSQDKTGAETEPVGGLY